MSVAGWDDLIDRHLSRQAVERGLSRHSMEAYAHDLSLFQSWCRDSGLEPSQLDAAALTAYLEALADQGFAVSSQRRHLASLRGLARELVDEKILERDPAPAVKLRPHPRKLPRTLSPNDIENLIAAIDAHDARGLRDRAMLEMVYGCGLRVSELVGLQLHQVNLAAGAVVVLGKGSKERMVPMGGAAIRALKAYLDRRDEILNPPGDGKRGKKRVPRRVSAVFITRLGRAMTRQGFFKALKGWAAADPRLAWISPHTCAIASRPICSRAAPICAPCRRCWVTATSRPRRFILICRRATCARCIARFIRARLARARRKVPTDLNDLNGTIATICIVAPAIMFAIIAHEVMHGVVALRLGDDTAQRAGRLTLNPISHIDLFGTIILPFGLYLFGLPVLGYAKPVPVDFRVLRGGRTGMLKVAAAGPLTNFVLAILSGLGLRILPAFLHGSLGTTVVVPLARMLQASVIVNVELGVFNLFPVLPLDGGRVLFSILPIAAARAYAQTERYGFLILLVLLYTHWLDVAIYPVMNLAFNAITWMVQL